MRLYPELARPRNRQLARDGVVLLALIALAFFAWAVRDAVVSLTAISTGFTDTAAGAQETWASVGDALSSIPVIGDDIEQSLTGVSDATLGNAVAAGESITSAVTTAANVLAFVTFAAPAAVLLVLWLPRRIDRARAWTAAHRVLPAVRGQADDLLALRALCRLPLEDLLRYTPQPFGAYRAGDYRPLVEALLADEGLNTRP